MRGGGCACVCVRMAGPDKALKLLEKTRRGNTFVVHAPATLRERLSRLSSSGTLAAHAHSEERLVKQPAVVVEASPAAAMVDHASCALRSRTALEERLIKDCRKIRGWGPDIL